MWLAPVTEDSGTGPWGKIDKIGCLGSFFQEGMAQFGQWEGELLGEKGIRLSRETEAGIC